MGQSELRLYGVLRRVMCNELDQQVRQVTKGPSEALTRWAQVYAATLAVRRASSPPNVFARWRSTQKKSFSWQITPSMIWRLPSEASPTTIGLRPRPAGIVVRGGRNQRSVDLQPAPLPLNPRKPFVCQIRSVTV